MYKTVKIYDNTVVMTQDELLDLRHILDKCQTNGEKEITLITNQKPIKNRLNQKVGFLLRVEGDFIKKRDSNTFLYSFNVYALLNAVIDKIKEYEKKDLEELEEARRTFELIPYIQRRIFVKENMPLLAKSEKIFVSFRFNWETYHSHIVITGRTYNSDNSVLNSEEILIRTPRIELTGACWSNFVAMRLLSGQMNVSMMLENTKTAIDYAMRYDPHYKDSFDELKTRKDKPFEVIKIDRCIYAPYLILLTEQNEEWMYKNESQMYMPYLKEKYPEAYHFLLTEGDKDNNFQKNYHDADVEAFLPTKQ